ncbi:glycosyltransferase [Hanstruepera flava]|uniref:glycosyltransferase n=1 Tax=Hanstruepera flava TaxID=2930218 RepID=UPI0020283AEC|nr:glycosyltransferase [Hanstruepera flava]
MKQRIGLVLSQIPGYSETFFRNKIAGLQAADKTVVLIVTDTAPSEKIVLGCEIVVAPSFKGSKLRVGIRVLKSLFQALVFAPKSSLRHFQLDRQANISVQESLKRLIQNAFFFKQDLDWLHFGFGMLAVGREHVSKTIKARMAVSFRGFDLYLSPLKHPNCYDLLFSMKTVSYHVLSHNMRRDLHAYGVPEEAIQVITPAIDVSFFNTKKERLFKELDKTMQIVTVARLHWKKGLEYTLEALAIFKQQGGLFNYTIIGSGEDYERLVFAVHQLKLEDVVTFTGRLSSEAVKEVLEASDIYLQYSIQEGFCNAVLEAQAMGLLCVVSNAEGLDENVQHGRTGWVVPKRKPQALADCLLEILQMTPLHCKQISNDAVSRVQQQFNLEQQQQLFLAFYEK